MAVAAVAGGRGSAVPATPGRTVRQIELAHFMESRLAFQRTIQRSLDALSSRGGMLPAASLIMSTGIQRLHVLPPSSLGGGGDGAVGGLLDVGSAGEHPHGQLDAARSMDSDVDALSVDATLSLVADEEEYAGVFCVSAEQSHWPSSVGLVEASDCPPVRVSVRAHPRARGGCNKYWPAAHGRLFGPKWRVWRGGGGGGGSGGYGWDWGRGCGGLEPRPLFGS